MIERPQYPCPYCDWMFTKPFGVDEVICPECGQISDIEEDGEYDNGRWHDLTRLTPRE